MLDALYKLGKLYIEKENLDMIDVLLDDKNIGAAVLVEFIEESNGDLKYNKVFHEEYDSKNKIKYLYKKKAPNGPNFTPSCLITEFDKTFSKKFLKWFERNKDKNKLFEQLNVSIIQDEPSIYSDLKHVLSLLEIKNANILLSIAISKNGEIKYLNDFIEFRDILKEDSLNKYQGPKKIKGDGVCCLCGEHKEVFGLVTSSIGFTFSTPEKIGNVPGNDIKNQWKLSPICSDCALNLNAGKNFVEKYLNISDFGLKYYVIPNFLFDLEKGFDKLYAVLQQYEDESNSSILQNIEYKLSKIVKRLDDVAEFKFLFYQASKGAFDILAYVETVIPSYLNALYKTQSKISDYSYFSENYLKLVFGKKHEGNFIQLINKNEKYYPCAKDNWYKRFLRDFINNYSKKIYIDTVVDIISNKKLDYNFLISRIINTLRLDWKNGENWKNGRNYALNTSVLKSLMLMILLNDLNLFKGGNVMNSQDEFSIELILNSPEKRATFLLGALTRKLMYRQYKELGSSPFYNKLWGLSLDQKKVQKLYPMVINKLREYDAAYMNLEEEISLNLAKSENNWKLNRDETSYYFVLGFTLPNFDKKEKEDDKNE